MTIEGSHTTPATLGNLVLPKVDGGELRLLDLRGKQVLLFCWASW